MPLGGLEHPKRRPVVTLVIIVLNIAVYAITSYENFFLAVGDYWANIGGFVPSLIATPSHWYRIFTSMFLHGDIFHILFNMYFLYLFGRGVEDAVGGRKFLALYMISGIGASVFHTAFSFLGGATGYVVPAIGASGAISGILGVYLILYPGTSLLMTLGFFPFPLIFPIRASYYIIFWFATQVIYGYAKLAGTTAVFAHAGGFIAGIALLPLIISKERINEFLLRKDIIPSYLTFKPPKRRGLGHVSKAVVIGFTTLVLVGTAYASAGLLNLGNIKSLTAQYTCEETPYLDYVGIQLPDVESQLANVSLDETRILLNRLNAVGLLYNENSADGEINLNGLNVEVPVRIRTEPSPTVVNVPTVIHHFKGNYDVDGFLYYGEGSMTTRGVSIVSYGRLYQITETEPITYNFKLPEFSHFLSLQYKKRDGL